MNEENHCTYKGKECNQFLDEGNGEKTVWWHISGLSGKKVDTDSPQWHTSGKPGDTWLRQSTPERIAKLQSEKEGFFGIVNKCKQCRAEIRDLLEIRNEAEPL